MGVGYRIYNFQKRQLHLNSADIFVSVLRIIHTLSVHQHQEKKVTKALSLI